MVKLDKLNQKFEEIFGERPRLFRAPGRVNLIGEHTDYNDGFVLPIAINYSTYIAGAPRADRVVRVHSVDFNEQFEFHLDKPKPRQAGSWLNYIEGVARTLEVQGNVLDGADLLIQSEVPIGGGLSSSAALEVASGFAFLSLADLPVARLALAKAGQLAEHNYVGAKVGLMDQLAAVFGQSGTALLIDCRSLEIVRIPVDDSDYAIVVCDSHVKHQLSASEYNTRRAECEQAVEILKVDHPHIRALRDVSVEEFDALKDLLPEPLRKRCRHVVTENARTLSAAQALQEGELPTMGQLMFASHLSLRDDYQVSCAELDLLVETAAHTEGVLGARLTGGGFGGCTVNLVRKASVSEFQLSLSRAYQEVFQITPTFHAVTTGNGVDEIRVHQLK
jgi:galactokinase